MNECMYVCMYKHTHTHRQLAIWLTDPCRTKNAALYWWIFLFYYYICIIHVTVLINFFRRLYLLFHTLLKVVLNKTRREEIKAIISRRLCVICLMLYPVCFRWNTSNSKNKQMNVVCEGNNASHGLCHRNASISSTTTDLTPGIIAASTV